VVIQKLGIKKFAELGLLKGSVLWYLLLAKRQEMRKRHLE